MHGRVITAIIIIVVILLVYTYRNTINNRTYLCGYWSSDDAFNEMAEVQTMDIFITDEDGELAGMLIIMDDIANTSFKLVPSYQYLSMGLLGGTSYNFNAKFVFDQGEPMPEDVNISIDIMRGEMLIKSADDVLLGRLYKVNGMDVE